MTGWLNALTKSKDLFMLAVGGPARIAAFDRSRVMAHSLSFELVYYSGPHHAENLRSVAQLLLGIKKEALAHE